MTSRKTAALIFSTLGMLSIACGGDEDSDRGGGENPTGGAGGTGGTGGTGLELGGTGADSSLPPPDPTEASELEACRYYVSTQCTRRNFECAGLARDDGSCMTSVDSCPDLLFGEGSNATVAAVLDCAERYRTASCDDLNAGVLPDCGFAPGSKALGEPCYFYNQCASGACAGPSPDPSGSPGCRQCVEPTGQLGDDCQSVAVGCAEGLECLSGACWPYARNLPEGAACHRHGDCLDPLGCDPTTETCAALLPGPGEPCDDDRCTSGSYCDGNGQCLTLPTLGEPCGLVLGYRSFVCADSRCLNTAGEYTCVAYLQAGESCYEPTELPESFHRGDCAEGLACYCREAGCPNGVCVYQREPGESCDPSAHQACVPGTECEAGVCVVTGLSVGLQQRMCPTL